MKAKSWLQGAGIVLLVAIFPASLRAGASGPAKKSLERLLMGKDVKALTQLPATKEGVDIGDIAKVFD